MSIARKIFSNTTWQIVGKAATAILGIISIKYITNYLSRSSYGEYSTIYDYTALFAIIADFGLFTIAVREMAHDGSKQMIKKIVGNVLSIRTVLAVVSLGLGVLIALMVPAFKDSHIPYGVAIVSVATVITLVAGTMSSILQYYLEMQWASIAVREMAHDGSKQMIKKIVGNVLSIRTVLAVISLGLGVLVAFLVPAFKDSHIPYGVAIVSVATVITLVAGTMSSILQYYLEMQWASIALTVGKVITVLYIVATVLYIFPNNPDAGFPHLLIAWIFGGLVTVLITYVASSRLIPVNFQFDFSFWKEVLIKALPYGLALVLGTVYFRMGTVMLSFFGMKEQAGYYGVSLRFLEILQIVPHYFMNSVLPILTLSLVAGGERSARIIKYSLNALSALAFPIFVGGFLLAWPLTIAVSSPDFVTHAGPDGLVYGSDMSLKILLVAMMFTFLHVALSYTLVAMGRQKELLWINVAVVIVNVSLNLILAPRYGFIGAAVSATAAEVVMLVLLIIRVQIRIKGIWDYTFLAKTMVSSGIMGVVIFFALPPLTEALQSKGLLILVPLGAAVFVCAMLVTKAISKEMIALFRKADPAGD